MGFSRKFKGCFKGVSRMLWKFHECFEIVSRKLKHIESLSKNICFVVVVVAASRAEGGLVHI